MSGAVSLDEGREEGYLMTSEATAMKLTNHEEVRRSPPEVVAEHKRWAPYAVEGATLADLRQLVGMTQEQVGKAMEISGVEAGRMEKRPDVQISTIRRFLAALGGELEVYARFGEKIVPLRFVSSLPKTAKAIDDQVREAGARGRNRSR